MAKAKTLLNKIQKGEIVGGESNRFSSFFGGSRYPVFRRRELIKPYLHETDSHIINKQIEDRMKTVINSNDFKEFQKLVPRHLINDVYSLYFNRTEKAELEAPNSTNTVKYRIVESINNSLIKIVSNNSQIASYVYTDEICQFLYEKFRKLPPEEQEKLKKSLENTNQGEDSKEDQKDKGKGKKPSDGKPDEESDEEGEKKEGYGSVDSRDQKGDKGALPKDSKTGMANNSMGNNTKPDHTQQALDKMLQNLLQNQQAKKELDQAFERAEKKLEKLKEIGIDYGNAEGMEEGDKVEILGHLENLDRFRSELRSLNTSKDKIMKAVNKILSKADNMFSKKCIKTDIEIFEADELIDLNNIELIHPFFRKSRLFDITVTQRKYIGKIDLYIDCSGSMGSGCGGELSNVPRVTLAKALAMQMKELGILGDLYEFEDRTKKIKNSVFNILLMDARGGTNLDSVMNTILKTEKNSVVLTDGESNISHHSPQTLFIGVGTNFSYFRNSTHGKKYIENGQCIVYNGKDFVTVV